MENTNYTEIVDTLADVLAAKADLEKKEKELKAILTQSGLDSVEGSKHKVSIALMPGRETVDTKALCSFLKVTGDILGMFTKRGNPFYTVKVVSR